MNGQSQDNNCSDLAAEQAVFRESAPAMLRAQEPFKADRQDGIFALLAFILGFYFARWVLFSWQGWGVTLFTLGYCGIITVYLLKKGVRFPKAGWFWLIIVLLTGISFSLWTNNGLEPWRSMLLFGSAVYWIICATGLPILGKTSNWIAIDGFNALLVIPFRNFGCQYKSLAFLGRHKRAQGRQVFSIALGLFLAFMVLGMVLPLLMKADSGGFAKITNGVVTHLHGARKEILELLLYGILAIPIAAYLFGLVAGCVHKRGCNLFKKDRTLKLISHLRVLPATTVYILLGLLCALYVVFIGSQAPYFFSALIGERPEGWQVYSEYARSGFFELCRIAAINLIVLLAANLLGQKQSRKDKALKIFNSLLAIITLVLIATALSKMAMYIGAYGLLMRRLLPCIFMVFLAIICGGVIALQKWSFSITRMAVGVGVVMLCTLCLFDPDSFVARYNAERYLSGALASFDVEILYRSGPAGVDSALKVYGQTHDQALQDELKQYLHNQRQQAVYYSGQPGDSWQRTHARQKIKEYFLK